MNKILEYLYNNEDTELFEMTNLSPKRTGLKVSIWSDGGGKFRQRKDHKPRIKIGKNDKALVSVGLEKDVPILAKEPGLKASDLKAIDEARNYIKRNLQLFKKHYNSHSDNYDDEDLKNDLAKKGEYKN